MKQIQNRWNRTGRVIAVLAAVALFVGIPRTGTCQTFVTELVKNINTFGVPYNGNVANITKVGALTYYSAATPATGTELWKSDGTAAGTVLVKEIYSSTSTGSYPGDLTAVGSTLLFAANDGDHGQELWRSDGTAAGTVIVKDIVSDTQEAGSSPNYFLEMGGTLYFRAEGEGAELWRSDGSVAGTVLVKDINPGASASSPLYLVEMGGALYFNATDGSNGNELWKSDGTEAGTVMVKDIYPGSGGSYPYNLVVMTMRGRFHPSRA
mgnify:CR=1 FL=1